MRNKKIIGFIGMLLCTVLVIDMLPVVSLKAETAKTEYVGDVDGDGNITPKDVTLLRRSLADGWNVNVSVEDGDVDVDGSITPKDVTMLRRYLTGGWGVELPEKQEKLSAEYYLDIFSDNQKLEIFINDKTDEEYVELMAFMRTSDLFNETQRNVFYSSISKPDTFDILARRAMTIVKRRLADQNRYFTCTGKSCTSEYVSDHGCDNCDLKYIMGYDQQNHPCEWYPNLFPEFKEINYASHCAYVAVDGNSTKSAGGRGSLGFGSWCAWYTYSVVLGEQNLKGRPYYAKGNLNFDFLKNTKVRAGDVLRLNGTHTVVVYSYNQNELWVLDCNDGGPGNCLVKYQKYSYDNRNIAVSRPDTIIADKDNETEEMTAESYLDIFSDNQKLETFINDKTDEEYVELMKFMRTSDLFNETQRNAFYSSISKSDTFDILARRAMTIVKRRLADQNKYFTCNGKSCTSEFVGSHGCDNCDLKFIMGYDQKDHPCEWYPNLFPEFKEINYASHCAYVAVDGNSTKSAGGQSCLGFGSWCAWYTYSVVLGEQNLKGRPYYAKGKLNFDFLKNTKVRAGDVLRLNGTHTVVVYSYNQNELWVLDCNNGGPGNCMVKYHKYTYDGRNIAVSRPKTIISD